ncbi:MAG: UDP-2,3-diacylglucosamine diphosphatase LpxI [Mariniblastus sp.]|nr:UDP-2,3-diacylglucosamine diphosphatase LpxI [Mariniblastus sp.]
MSKSNLDDVASQRIPTPRPKKIGLIAAWGDFPVRIAKALKSQGHEVYCLAIKNHADPELAEICDGYRVLGLGRMGAQVRFFRRNGITSATMAGKVFKTLLFTRRIDLLKHFPDLTFLKHFYSIFVSKTQDSRDDTMLNAYAGVFESNGITFSPATDFAPELLVKEGTMTRHSPNSSQMKDIEFGWNMAKQMGRLDIGQTVVIKNQAVMAVEAIEGTDACIKRAGELCKGGFVVVKVAKPNQDMRFDVPTIGEGTIKTIKEAGGAVLAIEADMTIVLKEAETIALAERLGISVIAINPELHFANGASIGVA